MSFETILLEKSAPLATITLNRPQVLSALNAALFTELTAAIEDVAAEATT